MDLLNNQEENKANNMDFAGSSRPGFMAALKSHGLALEIHKLSNYNQTCVCACVCVCLHMHFSEKSFYLILKEINSSQTLKTTVV